MRGWVAAGRPASVKGWQLIVPSEWGNGSIWGHALVTRWQLAIIPPEWQDDSLLSRLGGRVAADCPVASGQGAAPMRASDSPAAVAAAAAAGSVAG